MSSDNAYMAVYMLKRYHRRIAAARERLGGKCAQCGVTDGLQFDHIHPNTKLFVLAKGSSFSDLRWNVEVDKCQLLCQGCHDIKTIAEKGHKVAKGTHGTISSHYYCKCDICREAYNSYMRGRYDPEKRRLRR